MLKSLVLALINVYRASSRWRRKILPPICRFHPSCSNYMAQAIEAHGLMPGLKLGSLRILKCHPLHPGGPDPVPTPVPSKQETLP